MFQFVVQGWKDRVIGIGWCAASGLESLLVDKLRLLGAVESCSFGSFSVRVWELFGSRGRPTRSR